MKRKSNCKRKEVRFTLYPVTIRTGKKMSKQMNQTFSSIIEQAINEMFLQQKDKNFTSRLQTISLLLEIQYWDINFNTKQRMINLIKHFLSNLQ